ncbi:VTC domain-containing protein [Gongronella butleri]|nr:VTC domain-containing protein [Gongronella butleri]
MKFGEELQENVYEPWRFEYISYDAIKRDMKSRQLDHVWTAQDEKDFEDTLRLEADKVDLFITRKQREIDSRIAYCERILVQQRPNMTAATQQSLYDSMDDALTDILMDLNDLAKFTRLNFMGFQKLIKKHDKYTNMNRQQLLVDIVRTKSLDRQRFDVALVKISTLHDVCRLHGEARKGNAAAGLDQNAFERATAKYWVHPDNITELKAILLFHLPVLVFNPDKEIAAEDSAISSVYYDNPDFDLYNGRLQRDEGAEAIRFRWYGPTSSNSIFIERKTHHAPWLDGVSVKDRFRLEEPRVDPFVAGTYTADQIAHDMKQGGMAQDQVDANHFIAKGVQQSLREKSLSPVLRVFYNRTAFQVPGDQRLRLSLDTDLTFIREDGTDRRKNNHWRRNDVGIDFPFNYLPSGEVYRFPYAVLETKLQTHLGQEPPEWLTRLLDSKLVYEVPRFSKYLQGAAHFWAPQLPLLPWWLADLQSLDIRTAKQSTQNNPFSGLSRSKSLKPLIDGKYRMGYLESQLEKRATIKRKQSTNGRVKRQASTRSNYSTTRDIANMPPLPMGGAAAHKSYHTDNQHGEYSATVVSPKISTRTATTTTTAVSQDPFADPIWRQQQQQQQQQQSGGVSSSMYDQPRRRTLYDDNDASSSDYLMGKTPRSSVMHHTDLASREALNQTAYTTRDDSALEEGVVYSKRMKTKGEKKAQKEKDKLEKKKNRIEPKIYFANERTFIHWLYFAALLLTTALTLLNFGDKVTRISGGVFFGIAFGFAVYAFIRYRWRAYRIKNFPTERYDDLYGPIALCLLLVGALVLNYVLTFQHTPESGGFLGMNTTSS